MSFEGSCGTGWSEMSGCVIAIACTAPITVPSLGCLQRDVGRGLVAARARDVLHDDGRMAGNESSEMTPDQACVGVEPPADRRAHDDGDDLAPVKRFDRLLRRGGVRHEARGREAGGCKDKGTWPTIRHAGRVSV